MIIAIDGPAAAGKGTLARRLADHFGLAHLDTGALYRAVALLMLRAGDRPNDPAAALAAAKRVGEINAGDPALRDETTGAAASTVSTYPPVREALLDYQRQFAAYPPGGRSGAVIEGRDIGTVVCPDADHKIFVDASPEVRARRRLDELRQRGEAADYATVLGELKERDHRDRTRTISPLVPAADAYLLDTTELDIDSAFAAAVAFISRRSRNG
ncbi:MAG: (d)CMP kinase [Alphaproteobacteria bacterium]|nr:(d)CMP kinase [Alphaproteobacteria bacterium]